jgi:hypothetical protein
MVDECFELSLLQAGCLPVLRIFVKVSHGFGKDGIHAKGALLLMGMGSPTATPIASIVTQFF